MGVYACVCECPGVRVTCSQACRRRRYCCLPIQLSEANILGAVLAGALSVEEIIKCLKMNCGRDRAKELELAIPQCLELKAHVAQVSK